MAPFRATRLRAGALLFALVVLGPSRSAWSPPSAVARASWREGLEARLAAAEYEPSPGARGLSAPNRAHGLRLTWSADGVDIDDRLSGARLVTLTTLGVGRGSRVERLGSAQAVVTAQRVERAWSQLTEWWRNSAEGAEQGWTLHEPPPGTGPLMLHVAVAGADVQPTPEGLSLKSKTGRALTYGHLTARDADGRELSARLHAEAAGLRLEVEDDGARYPLVVDPLLTSASWVTEGNLALASFGYSVASAGDVNGDGFSDVIVGAHTYDNGQPSEGRAFVYLGSPSGLQVSPGWSAESNQAGALFGQSVASAGDVNGDGFSDVIIGAPQFTNDQMQEGRVFVYLGGPAGPSSTAWTTERSDPNASFGASVACAGDVNGDGFSDVIIGAFRTAPGGLAVVHLGGPAGLASAPVWTTGTPQALAAYGVSVASAGDVNGDGYSDIIVGASLYDQGELDEGQAFVYRGTASGVDTNAGWIAEGNQVDANLGSSVASAGDVNGDGFSDVIVGVRGYTNGQSIEGRALGFYGSASGLPMSQSWAIESDQADAQFGISVASAGDVNGDGYSDVVVGAHLFNGVLPDEGRVSLFAGSASGLKTIAAWTKGGVAGSAFGFSVASAGDVNGDGFSDVIIGSYLLDNGHNDEGRAVVFLGFATGLADGVSLSINGTQSTALLGASVASAGDFNGDGYSDIIVGAPQFDMGESDEGVVFIYLGGPTGVLGGTVSILQSDQMSAFFGSSVASAGDVNGDGFSDVIIGAFGFDSPEVNEGRAFVYLGSPVGVPTSTPWTAESNQPGANFGLSVASAGDVNGDGFSDVIVGAPQYDTALVDPGAAFVYLGSASGLTTQAWQTVSDQSQAYYGASVASAGDVNGDGFDDVLVGAYGYTGGQSNEGRVSIYHGSSTGLSLGPTSTLELNQAGAFFGSSVASAGDVNGDGLSDVIIGAPRFTNVEAGEGAAIVFLGGQGGVGPFVWSAEGNQPAAGFGGSVASAGDVNGDGFSDVLVGAEAYTNGQSAEGRAFVFHGSASGLLPSAAQTFESNQNGAAFGHSVASAGDVNGDGFSDVIIGVSQLDAAGTDVGGAVILHGGDGVAGLPRQLRQSFGVRRGAGANVNLPALLEERVVNATGVPSLRHSVEFEVKPVGVLFNGAVTARSVLALGGVLTSGQVSALGPGRYHWRARVRSGASLGRWVPFGGNQETEADFVVRPSVTPPDGGRDAGLPDGGTADAGAFDAGAFDAGAFDAGAPDAGALDAGAFDAGAFDAGAFDAGVLDAGATDGGLTDGGAGPASFAFVPTCGCGAAPVDLGALVVAALWWRRRSARAKPRAATRGA